MQKIIFNLYFIFFTTFAVAQKTNDVTTPLHAMKPDYPVPYEVPTKEKIITVIDRIYNYVSTVTPTELINKTTNQVITDATQLDTNTIVRPGDFRLTSYEWGVTLSEQLNQQLPLYLLTTK